MTYYTTKKREQVSLPRVGLVQSPHSIGTTPNCLGIDAKCNCRIGVARHLGHQPNLYPLSLQRRDVGMPRRVGRHVWQTEPLEHGLPIPPAPVLIQQRASAEAREWPRLQSTGTWEHAI